MFIAGTFQNAATFGGVAVTRFTAPPYQDNPLPQAAFVAKVSSAGTALWAQQVARDTASAPGGLVSPTALAYHSTGHATVAGVFSGASITFAEGVGARASPGATDAFLYKMSVADKPYLVVFGSVTGAGNQAIADLAVLPDDSLVAGGYTDYSSINIVRNDPSSPSPAQ